MVTRFARPRTGLGHYTPATVDLPHTESEGFTPGPFRRLGILDLPHGAVDPNDALREKETEIAELRQFIEEFSKHHERITWRYYKLLIGTLAAFCIVGVVAYFEFF
jgi:hypothetical protein